PLADEVAPRRDLPLPFHETCADDTARSDRARRGCHLRRADLRRYILLIENHLAWRHVDPDGRQKLRERRIILEIAFRFQTSERDGAIHRAGVEKLEAEPFGEQARRAALSGAGGAVDGDDHG